MLSPYLFFSWQRHIVDAIRRGDDLGLRLTRDSEDLIRRQRTLYRSAFKAIKALVRLREMKKGKLRLAERLLVDILDDRISILVARRTWASQPRREEHKAELKRKGRK